MAATPVALITGAARGIGAATAARLHAHGWSVVLHDADGAAVAETAAALGSRARAVRADVALEADWVTTIANLRAREGRLDGLVNNAGIMVRQPPEQLDLADWQRVLAVNLTGAFLGAKHAAPLLRAGQGAIVNLASTRAHMSEPHTEAYAATKAGLVGLTHALALSLGPDVRVNAVSPGWIETAGEWDELRPEDHGQHPVGRVGRPDDAAALIAWLLGPESGFVTGAEFVTDGGMSRKMIYL
jgi:NAD(P)-dependent dehydrogenase (short-subunit alcohol dehydrogenase family)